MEQELLPHSQLVVLELAALAEMEAEEPHGLSTLHNQILLVTNQDLEVQVINSTEEAEQEVQVVLHSQRHLTVAEVEAVVVPALQVVVA